MVKRITVYTIQDFRKWLAKNHLKENKVAVVLHKRHTGKDAPTHRHLLEEALCFGWVDTTIKRIDENTFIRHFSKRNEKGKWGYNTLSYAKQLKKAGRMSPEGLRMYALGLSRPTYDHGIPKNPDMPQAIKNALERDILAKDNFEKLAPSMKRSIYRWYLGAKQEETKLKRIDQVIARVKAGSKSII